MLFGSGGDGHGNLMTKTATENGTYTAAEEIDPETGEIFNPPKDGYSVFTVDLALDDKSVTLATSQITGSQTAVFEYDPHDENPELEGYSLFTIDLSGVKDDLEDLQQQLSDLEDCRDAVIAKIQEYDPQFDPQDCQDIVDKIDEDEQAKEDAEQAEDELEQCRDAVIAKIQEYFPSFNPQTCQDLVDKIEEDEDDREDAEEHEGYTFPSDDSDPDRYDKIAELVGNDNLTDNDLHIIVKPMDVRYPEVPQGQHNVFYGFYDSVTGAFISRTQAYMSRIDPEHTDYVSNFHITDPSTGSYTFDWVTWGYLYNPPEWGWIRYTYTGTDRNLIGYGDPTHSYTVTNKKSS